MEGYENDNVTLHPTQIFTMSLWNLNLPNPLLKLRRRLPKANSLELNLDDGGNQPFLQQSTILSSTPLVAKLHKEDLQATNGSTSLGVTASTIIHSESASGNDASTASIAKVDPRKYDPHDSVSKQQDKTKSASKGLETVLNESEPEKDTRNAEKEVRFGDDEFNTSPNLSIFDDAKKEIKLDDLSKLAHNVEVDFMDLDTPKDIYPIIFQDEDEKEVHAKKVQAEEPNETKDAPASQPLSQKSIKI
ncbi:hypothetical protein Tco_0630564 [Tanacetum coccineum]